MTVRTIPPRDVARLREQGQPVRIIDVRTPAEFAWIHVPGARLLPLDELSPQQVLADAGDEKVFVVCKSGGRSARACEILQSAGVQDVVSIEGGTEAWERAGLPVVRGGGKVISLERQVRMGAGLVVLLSVLLGWLVHPALLAITAFAGAGLVFAGVTDWCGMGMLLARMPWNRRRTRDEADRESSAAPSARDGACSL